MQRIVKQSVRLPSHVRPTRYQIMLKPDLDNFTFSGEETIFLTIDKPAKEIIIHCVELTIDNVNFAGIGKGKVKVNKQTETVSLTFPKTIPKGEGQLRLTFRGVLNDKMRGFYRSRYEVNGQSKFMAVTQFEATDARRAFPCFDEPAAKAIFDVTLVVPENTTAISNTIEASISQDESGCKIVKFLPTPKMSTYLLAFIVGDFEHIEKTLRRSSGQGDVLVRVFATPGKKEQGKFALDVAVKTLVFYEDYFGIPYPLPVLDLIAIPDFASNAMENWGAVTYRESTLLIDEETSSAANRQWAALVVAHELAHMWFGNLVTMEWWTHLWLNEGFASFIEYLAIDSLFPKWQIWTQFVYLENGTGLSLDGLKNTHPIEIEVHDPAEISEIFDRVSYSKGASIIRMLADYLGDDFKRGLCHYLKKHAFANAKTEDLWRALEEVSGKPVGKIMNNWTSKAGHPIINSKLKTQNSKLELTQSRFFASPISRKKTRDNTVWTIPLGNLLMDKKSMTIVNRGEKLNNNETSFVRVNYPAKYWQLLKEGVSSKKLPPIDRLGLVRDAFGLAKAGYMPVSETLSFARSYIEETDYTVWMQLAFGIDDFASVLANEPSYSAYKNYARGIFSTISKRVGWEKTDREEHTTALLRSLVLYRFGTYGDKKTIDTARTLFEKTQAKKTLDADLRGVVYTLIAENGGMSEYAKFLQMYRNEKREEEKERIIRALSSFRETKLLSETLAWSLSEEVRFHDTVRIINIICANFLGRSLGWEFIKKHWVVFKQRYGDGGHLLSKIISNVGLFTSEAQAEDVKNFFTENETPEIKRTLAQVLEQISANAAFLHNFPDMVE